MSAERRAGGGISTGLVLFYGIALALQGLASWSCALAGNWYGVAGFWLLAGVTIQGLRADLRRTLFLAENRQLMTGQRVGLDTSPDTSSRD
jgi:hypothetical protein